MKFQRIAFLALLILSVSCGGNDSSQTASSTPPPAEAAAAPATAEVTIEGNDLMKYNLETIEVTEGQKVKLTLKHVGKMSVEAMGHNWVLLQPGTDMLDFGSKAAAAKDNDYIPAAEADKVIAHTKTIGGGEETTIEFDAPAAGTYDFLCTFPGHYALMKGKFTVKANPAG